MLQQDKPEDFVIATGKQHSVKDFINLAAKELKMSLAWEGEGLNEVAKDKNGHTIIAIDPKYYRATEVETLLGDPSKAMEKLGWRPKTSFEDLVFEMTKNDLKLAESELMLKQTS